MAKGYRGMGGFGGGNMNSLMAQAQKMQRQLEVAKEEINELRVTGTSGGDKVKVVVGGDHRIYDLVIDKEVIDPEDPEMLADLIVAAVNQANDEVGMISAEKMNGSTGGVNLPF